MFFIIERCRKTRIVQLGIQVNYLILAGPKKVFLTVVVGIKHELSLAQIVLSMACLCQLLQDGEEVRIWLFTSQCVMVWRMPLL